MGSIHGCQLTAAGLLLLAAAVTGALGASSQGDGGPPYTLHRPQFVLLGDSLTEFGYGHHWKPAYQTDRKGWVALLSEAYGRKADVLNRGMSGYNSRWALQALPGVLADGGCSAANRKACRIQLLVAWFGSNDCADPAGASARQSVPLKEYGANLAALVRSARDAGVASVLLVTPPPVDEETWAKEQGAEAPDRTTAAMAACAAAVRAAAKAEGAGLVDVHEAFAGAGSLKGLLNDGLHLGPGGDALAFRTLKQVLDGTPGLSVDGLPNQFPLYSQVDAADPGKTFKDLYDKQTVVPSGGGR